MQSFRLFYFILALLLGWGELNFCKLSAAAPACKKSVCLNMIVKDESAVIARCLESVKPLIDYWVILDTGSTDGTQEIIKNYMFDIPGELHESPWVNFEHNRNIALDLTQGKGDYILFIDADETLEYPTDYHWPELDKDRYDITMILGNTRYARIALVKSALDWRWFGVLHEYLYSPQCENIDQLSGIYRTSKSDGHRSQDPNKFLKDASILKAALLKEPNNSRYQFYLAQSYRDAGEYALAMKHYQKRVIAGGWEEEVFISLLQIARLKWTLSYPPQIVIDAYYNAYAYRPTRAEPLCDLAKYYRSQGMFDEAYQIASIGMMIPEPEDRLFVEQAAYQYDLVLECSVAAYWLEDYEKCRDLSLQLLLRKDIPSHVRKVIQANLSFANTKLVEKIQCGGSYDEEDEYDEEEEDDD